MNIRHIWTMMLTLGLMVVFPQLGSAQQGGQQNSQQGQPTGQQQQMQLPPAVQAMFELQGVRQRLREVRQQAFQDSALAGRARKLENQLLEKMKEIDPQAGEYMDRLEQLRKEYSSAESMGDSAMTEEIAAEGRKLAQKVNRLRSQVLQDGQIVEKIDRFQQDLEVKMQEIEPQLDSLRTRADSLQKFLQENMPQQQGGQLQGGEQQGAPQNGAGGESP